MLLLLLL
jgi:hypothetical protein